MRSRRITLAIIITLALTNIVTVATCHRTGRMWEERAREARGQAEDWERRAGDYADALRRAEDANRRAEQSTLYYIEAAQEADGRREDARQAVEEMRGDGVDCGWLDERVPDGVRDVIRGLYPGDCRDRDQAARDTAGAVQDTVAGRDRDE
jgi:hypothetical protein